MAGGNKAIDVKTVMASAEAGDAAAQLRLSQLFRQSGDAAHAVEWLDKSALQGFPPAIGERGLWRLSRLDLPKALNDLEIAAQANDSKALMALAGLAVTGVAPMLGGWVSGIAMTIDAAKLGNKIAWRELALLVAMAGRQALSNELMAYAAAQGDGIAVFAMLTRGESTALDASRARGYRAALKRIGFPLTPPHGDGADGAFPPAGPTPDIDWPGVETILSAAPGLTIPARETVSAAPDVWLVRGFLTAEECDYVVAAGAPGLAPARVVDPVSGQGRQDPLRTNLAAAESTAWMTPAKAALALRLARFAGLSLAQAEPAGLLSYRPGEEYRPHFDWLGPGPLYDAGGQRLRTVLVYLNDGYAGGQTRFLSPALDVRAQKGDAVLFSNVDGAGQPDMTTRHAGMPVLTGVKYLWSQWYRERPVMPFIQ